MKHSITINEIERAAFIATVGRVVRANAEKAEAQAEAEATASLILSGHDAPPILLNGNLTLVTNQDGLHVLTYDVTDFGTPGEIVAPELEPVTAEG